MPQALLWTSLASLLFCGVNWPEARIGVWVNLALAVVVLAGLRLNVLP